MCNECCKKEIHGNKHDGFPNKWKHSHSHSVCKKNSKPDKESGCSNSASPTIIQNTEGGDASVVAVGLLNILNVAIGGAAASVATLANTPIQVNVCDNEVEIEA